MRVGLITSRPGHPLLAGTAALLTPRHEVETLDPETAPLDGSAPSNRSVPSDGPASSHGTAQGRLVHRLADVYLLKARTPRALALARRLEQHGAVVINSAAATAFCQDRTAMAERALAAGLPFAPTRTFATLQQLAARPGLVFPCVVKSRHSRRGDLVARVDDADALRALCGTWADEPVVVQPFTPNDGWDHKLWVIDGQVFAARRRSELAAGGKSPGTRLRPEALPDGWTAMARAAGAAFSLDVYGIDLVVADDGSPTVVDVNAFPGLRGQPTAPRALADLTLRTGAEAGLLVGELSRGGPWGRGVTR
ncbi:MULTISPECIES: ATP-grasp domain-containing protein [Streptomyces]|nr:MULTISPECIES: alpha-L-glutamate ligase [Streptomyces]